MDAQQLSEFGLTEFPMLTGGTDEVIHGADSAFCTLPVKCQLHEIFGHASAMSTPESERLRIARERAKFLGPGDAAKALAVPLATYTQHENGTRGFKKKSAEKYARKFGVSAGWLLTGFGERGTQEQVPVVGYIGAGAEIHPIDDHPQGEGIEKVEPPQGVTGCVAAIVKGESMHPLKNGWLVFWAKDQDGVPEECIGNLCVVQVKDGPMMLKEVWKGTKRGYYQLVSWNAPPRDNIRLEWASRIIDIRPR